MERCLCLIQYSMERAVTGGDGALVCLSSISILVSLERDSTRHPDKLAMSESILQVCPGVSMNNYNNQALSLC